MPLPRVTAFARACRLAALAAAGFLLGASAGPALAEHPATTLATLLDRAQIEDLLVDYYNHLGNDESSFGTYYMPDGVLDVNGLVAQGEKPIAELYKKVAAGSPHLKGTFHMLLSNPMVVVNGDTAIADVLWTGVISETVQAAPRFVEQGREHDELVKRKGRWYFKHRVITSDGGLPPLFEKLYKVR